MKSDHVTHLMAEVWLYVGFNPKAWPLLYMWSHVAMPHLGNVGNMGKSQWADSL